MKFMKLCLIGILLPLVVQAHTLDWQDSPEIGQLFKGAGVTSTLILYDIETDHYIGHDLERAQTRFVPASTYKIPHTLIGLDAGAVESVDEVFPYDGEPRFLEAWEAPMGLRDAIRVSNVPVYQQLSRRIGLEDMQAGIDRLGYGNQEIGEVVDRFWLDGPLAISAVEQTRFLAKLAQGKLPFPEEHQRAVRDILLLERGEDYALYGKTGWENAPEPGVGWWVGWVERGDRVYAFALNLNIEMPADAEQRIPLGRAALQALGVLDQ